MSDWTLHTTTTGRDTELCHVCDSLRPAVVSVPTAHIGGVSQELRVCPRCLRRLLIFVELEAERRGGDHD